eukprot:TRINITY_DN3782_c0_g1_i6.p1 TRINITY_DN3782_c0_g1~~TRINITY_DN3782_c0_g1_i6.p1  ORF type:complete len:221 (-),score=45.33 TRINITY_DN3782_c0_g1_i6:120-782(-)
MILGQSVVRQFKNTWKIANVDLNTNEQAHHNILLDRNVPIGEQVEQTMSELRKISGNYDAIISLVGGPAQDSIKDVEVFSNFDKMLRVNVEPSLFAGHLASKILGTNGFLLFTGSSVAFSNTEPTLLSYTLAKNSVHMLSLLLSTRDELPDAATVVTILPDTLDTEKNRELMPENDRSTWLPPDRVARLIREWADGKGRPTNGSFAHLKMKEGTLIPEFI